MNNPTGLQLTVADARQYRAVTFGLNGQRVETWLPKGRWDIEGQCNLPIGRGSPEKARAIKLTRELNDRTRQTWYVGPAQLACYPAVIPEAS